MLNNKYELTRLAAENDFEKFINLVQPLRMLGAVHREWIRWMTRQDAKPRKLSLLPRDHQKSAIAGLWAAWKLTRNPAEKILYVSSTSTLAVQQLKFIKDILTSDTYRLFWPDMINVDEAKRAKWSETAITVDHPLRKELYIRDPSIYAVGLTSSVTGLHPDTIVFDDIVVYENAYTEEGRAKVSLAVSFLASVESAVGEQFVVGTHYGPNDEYMNMKRKVLQLNGKEEPLYDVFEKQVENRGDGTGEFLWPRQKSSNGMEFGFNEEILANKRALYAGNEVQFYSQYYNNPNMGDNEGISRECFQYYDKSFLSNDNGTWYFKSRRLNIIAAMDFAYTTKKQSDYTAIVVVGADCFNNYYVLDIQRFKTGNISEYYERLLELHNKWGFWKVVAETTAAQEVIVNDLKVNYIRPNGLGLTIEPFKPSKYQGAKEERMQAALQPRYLNGQMWHYLGGNCQTLEEELILRVPPHDDVKDALTTAVISLVPPIETRMHNYNHFKIEDHVHRRFGGVS